MIITFLVSFADMAIVRSGVNRERGDGSTRTSARARGDGSKGGTLSGTVMLPPPGPGFGFRVTRAATQPKKPLRLPQMPTWGSSGGALKKGKADASSSAPSQLSKDAPPFVPPNEVPLKRKKGETDAPSSALKQLCGGVLQLVPSH